MCANEVECTESDFRGWAASIGLSALDIDNLVRVYEDDVVETGAPAAPAGATQWYWAQRHAGSDAWGFCPARRVASWSRALGQDAFLYYWTYVPDGPNGGSGERLSSHCTLVLPRFL